MGNPFTRVFGGFGRGVMSGFRSFKNNIADPLIKVLKDKESLKTFKGAISSLRDFTGLRGFGTTIQELGGTVVGTFEGMLMQAFAPILNPLLDGVNFVISEMGKGLTDLFKGIGDWWYMQFGGGKEKLRQERIGMGMELEDLYRLFAPEGISAGEMDMLLRELSEILGISVDRLEEGTQGFADIVTPLFEEFERRIRLETYEDQGISAERISMIERDRELQQIENERRHQESLTMQERMYLALREGFGI